MIAKFSMVGEIHEILPRHPSSKGDSVTFTLNVGEDRYNIVAIGKIMELVSTSMKVGDLIYVDGKLVKDRHLLTVPPKNVCILFANHLNIIREGD